MSDRSRQRQPDPAAPPPPAADAALLATLGAVVAQADPVPPELVAAARATLTWRTIDAELAELAFDSVEDGLAGVRAGPGTAAPRQLGFEAAGGAVEIELGDGGLVGQVVPPGPATVELEGAGRRAVTQADELGRFAFDIRVFALPTTGTTGAWRLRVDAGAFRLVTAWFTP